ncbi:MAG: hypothetical protein K2N77_06380, partial [Lachnospiraceae bacterium]|nr:hypothetical protein [Lachnospiraceae bacterium]
MIKKFIMLAGFAIAVTSFVFQYIKDIHILIIVFLIVYLVLWLLLDLEEWMRDAEKDFFNKYFYLFSKNTEEYIIEYVESHYEYINKHEMKYSKSIEVKACTNNVKIYKDNFCWSSHSNSIAIIPK